MLFCALVCSKLALLLLNDLLLFLAKSEHIYETLCLVLFIVNGI